MEPTTLLPIAGDSLTQSSLSQSQCDQILEKLGHFCEILAISLLYVIVLKPLWQFFMRLGKFSFLQMDKY